MCVLCVCTYIIMYMRYFGLSLSLSLSHSLYAYIHTCIHICCILGLATCSLDAGLKLLAYEALCY